MIMPALPCRLLFALLLFATLPFVIHADTPRDPAASRQIYNTIHEQLEPGGDLIVIPQNGTYTINPIGVDPTCSMPEHHL